MFKWLKNLIGRFRKDNLSLVASVSPTLTCPIPALSGNISCVTLSETPPFGSGTTDGKSRSDVGFRLNSALLHSSELVTELDSFSAPPLNDVRGSTGTATVCGFRLNPELLGSKALSVELDPDDATFLKQFDKPKKKKSAKKKSKKKPKKKSKK